MVECEGPNQAHNAKDQSQVVAPPPSESGVNGDKLGDEDARDDPRYCDSSLCRCKASPAVPD